MKLTVSLAVEIAREQGSGRGRVGVTFVVGDPEAVLARLRPLALDPLRGHPAHLKRLDEPGARGTLKQLARLGEAFVVSDEGVALSVVRHTSVLSGYPEDLPASARRLYAAASISGLTGAVVVVVSEDSAVRVFDGGRLVRGRGVRDGQRRAARGRFRRA